MDTYPFLRHDQHGCYNLFQRKLTGMGAMDVLRCAISARTRVASYRALSFPVKRCPFSTKRTVPGVLQYHPSTFRPSIDTISKCAEAAKTPQTIIEWFPAIKIGRDLFEIK